jgi:hypothetical protein
MSLRNQVRREQTEWELDHLGRALTEWLAFRRAADRDEQGQYIGRHKTQLETLESTLMGSVKALQRKLAGLKLTEEVDTFFATCREYDRAVVWLERAWEYYREKFDQRDDPQLGSLVKAADEVIWSCYRQVFAQAELRQPQLKQGSAPLAFIEPTYSPGARQSHKVPPDIRPSASFLKDFLRTLPVPLLRLPPWCVDAPWWLVFTAHEVGHFVVYDLKLLSHFREGIREAAAAHGLCEADQNRWAAWTEEIFADIFSIMMMGPWALWSMVEIEYGPAATMVRRRKEYPSAVVRLKLMAATNKALGIFSSSDLRGVSLKQIAANDATAQMDMNVAKEVAALALKPLPGNLGTLPALCRFQAKDFSGNGRVSSLATRLKVPAQDKAAAWVKPALEAPRHLVGGALKVWSQVDASKEESFRREQRISLAKQTVDGLLLSGEPGTRSQLLPDGHIPEKGDELAEFLLNQARQESASEES